VIEKPHGGGLGAVGLSSHEREERERKNYFVKYKIT
jgi:hypothetical protein